MNGLMKNLFLLSLVTLTLYSCVPAEVSMSAQCDANEAYDAVQRKCYSTVVPLRPPKPTLSSVSLTEDGPSQSVTLTYTDVDGDQATACAVFNFAQGIDDTTSACSCAGGVCTTTLTSDPEFSGHSEFFYTLTDTNGVSAAQSVSVYVTPTNDAPTALDGSFTTSEEVTPAVSMDISGLGSDPDFDNIYFVKISDPTDGTIVTFDAVNGIFTYLPPEDNYGVYTFLYKVCDYGSPTLCSDNKTITITVDPVDDAPIVADITATGVEDAVVLVNLPYTDIESDLAISCNVLSLNKFTAGTCLCAGGFCQASLIPDADFNSDLGDTGSFTYNVITNGLTSNTATASVTMTGVNDILTLSYTPGPTATTVPENTTVTLANATNVSDPYQFDIALDADEGGGVYEDAQTLFLDVRWSNISAPVGAIISKVEIYYGADLKGTFEKGDGSAPDVPVEIDAIADGDFDPSKLFIKVVPTADESGKVGISFRVHDSEQPGTIVNPNLTTQIEFITSNDPPVIGIINDMTINEADIRYTNAISITEAATGSEESDDIWVAFDSSDTSLLPMTASNISVYSQYTRPGAAGPDPKKNIPWPALKGCDDRYWFPVDSSEFSVGTITDEDNSHYNVFLKLNGVNGISGFSQVTLYAMDRNPGLDPVCENLTEDGVAVPSKVFTYTVNPIGATHGGWTKISAFGQRKDRFGNTITFNGQSTSYVDLAWNTFSTSNSGSGTAENISGWHLFRRKTGEEYDFDSPLTFGIDIPANTFNYQDPTVTSDTVYYYTVRPVDSSESKYTIPTEEVFSEVRVFVPGDNTAFIHRWMMNKEVCAKMLATEGAVDPLKRIDPINSYRCRFEGPGEVYDSTEAVTYYDVGHDLLVDVAEIGCPYSTNIDEPNCSANGCIGTDHTIITPSEADSIFYNRNTGTCYLANIPGWSEMDSVAAYVAGYADKATNMYLPPIVNMSQAKANEFCKARTDVTGSGLNAASPSKYALPTRLEQIAYSAWDVNFLYSKINELEEGKFLNSESKCNSSAASGIEMGYTDVDVPPTSYLYSLPGTKSSQIRSIYTGSQALSGNKLTGSCISRYGIQDVYGNVAEWTRDRFVCHPEGNSITGYNEFECDALTEAVDDDLIADVVDLPLYISSQILRDGENNASHNYYQVVDSFFDHYIMNGTLGPCNDPGSDGTCDAPMEPWIFYKEGYSAGGFSFPVGLPLHKDYIANATSGPANYVLQIGSTAGIKNDDLQNDTAGFNTYGIGLSPNRVGGIAAGGSYLATSEVGRYSMELITAEDIPGISAGATVGSNYLASAQLTDAELQLGYLNIAGVNEIEILSVVPLVGGHLTVATVDPADGLGGAITATFDSAARTLVLTYDSTLADADAVTEIVDAINGAADFSAEFVARIHSSAGAGAGIPTLGTQIGVTLTSLRMRSGIVHMGELITIDFNDTANDPPIENQTVTEVDQIADIIVEMTDGTTTFSEIATLLTYSGSYVFANVENGLGSVPAVALSSATAFVAPITFTVDYNDGVTTGTPITVQYTDDFVPGVGVPTFDSVNRILNFDIDANETTYSQLIAALDNTPADGALDFNTAFRIKDNTAAASDGPIGIVSVGPIEKTFMFSAVEELSGGQVSIVINQSLAIGDDPSIVSVDTTPVISVITVATASDNTTVEIVNLLKASAAVTSLINVEAYTVQENVGNLAGITTAGDLTVASKSTGTEWNEYSVTYNDGVATGDQYIELNPDKLITVYISSGYTTADQIKALFDNDDVLMHIFNVTVNGGRGSYVQGSMPAVSLKGGITNAYRSRVDVGFRCVAPVRHAQYDADSFHPYQYKNCLNTDSGGPDGETKVICL